MIRSKRLWQTLLLGLALFLVTSAVYAAVDLLYFSGTWSSGQMPLLAWGTESEQDSQGFYVWRSTENLQVAAGSLNTGQAVRVSDLIIGFPCDPVNGDDYNFTDDSASSSSAVYYYFIESLNCDGTGSVFYGDNGNEDGSGVQLNNPDYSGPSPTPQPPATATTPPTQPTATTPSQVQATATTPPTQPTATTPSQGQATATVRPSATPRPGQPSATPSGSTSSNTGSGSGTGSGSSGSAGNNTGSGSGNSGTTGSSAGSGSSTGSGNSGATGSSAGSGSSGTTGSGTSPTFGLPTLTPAGESSSERPGLESLTDDSAAGAGDAINRPNTQTNSESPIALGETGAVNPGGTGTSGGTMSQRVAATPTLASLLSMDHVQQPPESPNLIAAEISSDGVDRIIQGFTALLMMGLVAMAGFIGWIYFNE